MGPTGEREGGSGVCVCVFVGEGGRGRDVRQMVRKVKTEAHLLKQKEVTM